MWHKPLTIPTAASGHHEANSTSSMPRAAKSHMHHYWCSSTAKLFLGLVNDLAKKVSKPLVIVLDNAGTCA